MNKFTAISGIAIAAALGLLSISHHQAWAAYPAPTWGRAGMAATPHRDATRAAELILAKGGNAVDATVAAAFALAVVEPYHSGLGGGEFTLIYSVKTGQVTALDARETAPMGATPQMYYESSSGSASTNPSQAGGLAVGVPGSVAGRVELIKRYGALSLQEVIAPARELAEAGFIVDRSLADRLNRRHNRFAESKDIAEVFLPGGKPPARGARLRQPALARTLQTIAKDAGESFHRGAMAQAIVRACRASGGILTGEDLENYRFIWREPVRFQYRGLEIYSMPPPSSGGICLAEIFNILEPLPIGFLGAGSAASLHLVASAFEQAFADRSAWLGDPAFAPLPTKGLTAKGYADSLRRHINRDYRTPVRGPGDPWMWELEGNTSHISVIDKWGNMCAMTTSVNTEFGSLVFVPEGGFFLNSTMDDFATQPKTANKYELTQGEVNDVRPGKRPLSSMSPTLVFKDGKPFLSLGSVGGPRIITSVAQIIINIADHSMDVKAAVDAPRIHMQWRPDKLYLEDDFGLDASERLRQMGWNVMRDGRWSLSQAVLFNSAAGEFLGATDARGVGSAGPAGD